MFDREMMTNGSGYTDTAAHNAVMDAPKTGEIWTYSRRAQRILVLKNCGWFCTALALVDTQYEDCVNVKALPTPLYANPAMVQWCKTAELGQCIGKIDKDKLREILTLTGEALGFRAKSEHAEPDKELAEDVNAYLYYQQRLLMRLLQRR